ncbi:MAG: hypothetical protein K8I60_00170 [Anaerolineae bacterium]|nr:hypothetical protein [Anaerolineae bacterium]
MAVDPISMIAAAFVTAAANLAEPVVKDAYGKLKAIISKKLEGDPKQQAKVEMAVEGVEQNPETWKAPLADTLKQTGLAQDADVLAAIRELQQALAKIGAAGTTVTGTQVGGSGNVQQNIGNMSGGTVIGNQTNYGRDDDRR